MAKGIKVNTRSVAGQYAASGQKIIEYSSPHGGGLISFRMLDDGTLAVDLYRHDDTVTIGVDDRCVKPATRWPDRLCSHPGIPGRGHGRSERKGKGNESVQDSSRCSRGKDKAMKFTLTIETGNAAFMREDEGTEGQADPWVVADVVRDVAEKLADGHTEGKIKDPDNGIAVGSWKLEA